MEDSIPELWKKAKELNEFCQKHKVTPLFLGAIAKTAITRTRGVTKDVDLFVYNTQSQLPKTIDEIIDLTEKVAKEFGSTTSEINHYCVRLNLESEAGDIKIELLHESEWLSPKPKYLERSREFEGFRVLSLEDWIVFKLEAIRDRTPNSAQKHEDDLFEVAGFVRSADRKLDLIIIQEEIETRDNYKRTEMWSKFYEAFPEFID